MPRTPAWFAATLLAVAAQSPAAAQTESQLKGFFEGRTVTVKFAMPATAQGVDLFPGAEPAVDVRAYGDRIKQFGTALRPGDQVVVTLVKVKSNLIEFQLGGGGYGTLGDDLGSTVSPTTVGESPRERELKEQIKRETDTARKRQLERELAAERDRRERDNQQARAAAEAANAQTQSRIEQKRLGAGSRFNIRYRGGVPPAALTPAGIMQVLHEYLEFPPELARRAGFTPSATADGSPGAGPNAGGGFTLPWRGMTVAEAEGLYGRPASIGEQADRGTTLVRRTWYTMGARIEADFAEGRLVRYVITPE